MTAKTDTLTMGMVGAKSGHEKIKSMNTTTVPASVMTESIRILYGTAKSIKDFIDEHIEEMKRSENHTVSRSGDVLDAAKYGFGVGFISPVIIVAAGQMILGNPLMAMTTVATAPINPVALTCGAVGAIYYGWNVLSDQEKQEILEKLSKGLEIGIEMIKSVIHFVTQKMKELLSAENLLEMKKFISKAASVFGKTLADVTKTIRDRVVDGLDVIKKRTGEAVDKTGSAISESIHVIKEHGEKAIEKITSKKEKSPIEVQQGVEISQVSGTAERIKIKMNSKGQLTIPSSLRKQLGLAPNADVHLVMEGDIITLRKA